MNIKIVIAIFVTRFSSRVWLLIFKVKEKIVYRSCFGYFRSWPGLFKLYHGPLGVVKHLKRDCGNLVIVKKL